MEPPTGLGYRRPTRVPEGLFAGRFAVLFAVGIVAGAGLFLLDGWLLLGSRELPAEVLGQLLFRLIVDVLLIFGSLAGVFRRAWSRTVLRTAAGLQLGDLGVSAVLLLMAAIADAMPRGQVSWVLLAMLIVLLRSGFAVLVLVACRSMYADFYFGRHETPDATAVAPSRPVTRLEQRAARFTVYGTDRATGRPASFESKAATEVLARQAAEALGLEPGSIVIEPIAAVDAGVR